MSDILQRIENDYSAPVLTAKQDEEITQIRAVMKAAALLIAKITPPCREQSLALTNMETAMFFAQEAITRNQA